MTTDTRQSGGFFSFNSIGGKLRLAFMLVGLSLIIIIGATSYFVARNALEAKAFDELTALRDTRAVELDLWLTDRFGDARTLSANPTIIAALQEFQLASGDLRLSEVQHQARVAEIRANYLGRPDTVDVGDGSEYSEVHAQYYPLFRDYLETYEYRDIFLVEVDGDVIFSVTKEDDFLTDIFLGEYNDSGLATAVREAQAIGNANASMFVDFTEYAPSGNTPQAFISSPIYDGDELVGVLVFQLPIDRLNAIMNLDSGLGESGETYVVGSNGLFRNDSRFIADLGVSSTILNPDFEVDTVASQSLFATADTGYETIDGAIIEDYRGRPVLSTWEPFVIQEAIPGIAEDVTWGIIAEIDTNEAFAAINNLLIFIVTVAVVAGVVVLGFSYWLANQIATPLQRATDAAEKIAAGDLEQQIEVTTHDEVGVLSHTINQMAGQLKETFDTMEQRIQDRTRDMASANEVGRLVTGIQTEEDLLATVTTFIQNSYELYYTQVYLLDDAKRYAVLRSGTGDVGRMLVERQHKLPLEETSLVARAARSGQPILVTDTDADATHRKNDLLPQTRSELAVPLLVGNDILGVLDMQDSIPERFNEENVPVFQTMAAQVASALRRTQAYNEIQEAILRSETINRRLTEETWEGYLARLERGGKIGYLYDLEDAVQLDDKVDISFENQQIVSVNLRGQKIGTIKVADDRPHQWSEEELSLIKDVSDRLALALEQFRAFDEVDKRAAEMETVANVTTVTTTILDVEELLGTATTLTRDNFGLYHAHVYLVDEDRERLELAAGAGEVGREMVQKKHRIELINEKSLVARAARTLDPVIENDITQAPNFLPNKLLPDTRSELALPMMAGEDLIGILDVQAVEVGHFNEEDVQVLSILASQLAVAVRNARLFKEVTDVRHAMDQHTIVGITDQRGRIIHVNDIFCDVSKYSREELLGQDHRILNSGYHSKEFMRDLWVTIANGKVWKGIVKNLAKDGSFYWVDTTIVPFLNNEGKPYQYVAMRSDITAQVAQQEQIRRRAAEMETVANVTTVTTTILDVEELLRTASNLTRDNFGLYHAHVYLADEDGERLDLTAGAGDVGLQMVEQKHRISISNGQSLVARAARSRDAVFENDVTLASDFLANPFLPDTHSELALPMTAGNELIGVLDVQARDVGRFGEEDIKVLSVLASQLAVAVRNARLFKEVTDVRHAMDQHTIVGITDQRGRIIHVNDIFCDISKYSREELLGQDHRILNSGYHPKEFMRDLWVTIANGKVWKGIVKNKAKDGSFYWVDTTIVPFLNVEGKPYQYVAMRSDITSQVEQREQIRRRATEMETIARVSTATTTLTDVDELLQSVANLTKESFDLYHVHIYLYDADAHELVLAAGAGDAGRIMKERGHKLDADSEVGLVAQAVRNRKSVIVNDVTMVEGFLPNPLLPQTHSEMAVPMIVGDEVIGVIDVQSDIVDRFDEEDARIKRTLADQIAIAVQNAQAFERERKTVEQLREVDRLKQEFLANMSHELRTPLNSIIGYSEVLLDGVDGDLTEDAVEDVEAIYGSGKHLLNIINEILDLAKIDAGQMRLSTSEKDITEILKHIVVSSQVLVKDKDVEIKLEEVTPIETVEIDPIRINQIMLNLVGNAIKFTEKGHITVRYGMTDDNLVRVEVEDTGTGMSPEQLEVIFERFRQVDGSSTRRAGGTGLGLTITKQFVEMHGGEIGVESDVGYGTTFWFVLPTAADVAAANNDADETTLLEAGD